MIARHRRVRDPRIEDAVARIYPGRYEECLSLSKQGRFYRDEPDAPVPKRFRCKGRPNA
jgi:hypothetical protein